MAAGAVVLAVTGGSYVRSASVTDSTPAPETMIVDLALPGSEGMSDRALPHPKPSTGAGMIASREAPSDPLPVSHPPSEAAADDLPGSASSPPVDALAVEAAVVLAVTGGSYVRSASVTDSTPAPETMIVDLALPGSEGMSDRALPHPKPSTGAGMIASREAPSDPLPVPHPPSEAAADDLPGSASSAPVDAPAVDALAVDAPVVEAPAEPGPGTAIATAAEPSAQAAETIPPITGEAAAPENAELPPAEEPAHRVTVERGDSLYLIFKRLGLPQRDLALMTASEPLKKKLARIAPGQEIEFHVDAESRLTRLVHRADMLKSLHVSRDGDTFTFEEIVETPEVSVATATGVIDSSLFEAGLRAGLSDNVIMLMTDIFAWDVDFALDIRVGDRFALVFEEQFKGGEKVGEGPIVAAEFTNRGRRIRAVRYVDSTGRSGYFSPDGRSMRKAFLRTPVNFTRISSRFNLKRRHPILHKIRAHRGVDYAAPRGTAVKASGDGKVIFAGRKGGYGRTVIVQHGSVYTTLYAHLSRFSKGLRSGKRVRQGQTIGYVGSTGLATGPHLHYEFRVRGTHRDPLKVKLPKAAPLEKKYMDDFREKADPLLAKLDLLDTTSVATAE